METKIRLDNRYYHLQDQMYKWCKECLGPGYFHFKVKSDARWSMSSMFGNTEFKFVDEKDATMFALRWLNGQNAEL